MFDRATGSSGEADDLEAMSFRARLKARQASRPQSTFAIDSGIVYRQNRDMADQARRAAIAARDAIEERRAATAAAAAAIVPPRMPEPLPEPEPAPPPRPEPVVAAAPPATVAEPEPETVSEPDTDNDLKSIFDEIAARHEAPAITPEPEAPEIISEPAPEMAEEIHAEATMGGALPMSSGKTGWNLFGGGDDGYDDDDDDDAPVGVATRIGDISQIAFAGLAVLGLAGLSVMAAESALKGNAPTTTTPGAPKSPPGAASAVAIAAAAPEEAAPKAWFNYQGMADMLAARKSAMDAEAAAAQAAAEEEAKVQAANAIAEAEAQRLADEQAAAAAAAEQERLAEEAERQRLADAEAARVAEAEAQKAAEAEALRQAAADAEARRVAEVEAKKKAEADAEAKRLADLEAKRLADLEAQRKAAEDAARQEAFERAKAEEAEKLRLAALKADQEAKAEEARRIEAAAAKAEADRLAAQKAAAAKAEADRLAAQKVAAAAAAKPAAPQPIVFSPYDGPVPMPASFKPAKPASLVSTSSVSGSSLVTRTAPATLTASNPSVRDFDGMIEISPQAPEDFLASRVERNAKAALTEADLAPVRDAFVSMLTYAGDAEEQGLATPSGPALNVTFERTYTRSVLKSSVRTISYSMGDDEVNRAFGEPVQVKVSVMCRDVYYTFEGRERGRFAACERPEGGWALARATERPTASLTAPAP